MNVRKILLAACLAATAGLSGCMSTGTLNAVFTNAYGAEDDGGYVIPAVPISDVPVKYRRQEVDYDTSEKPGTIIVDTKDKFLYYVMGDDKAMRYGIGVGRQGFSWKGTTHIAMKREWPHWTPPSEMIKRQPELAKYRHGMDPGLMNPLGARALYLFTKGGDTGYRLHGSPEWNSIGHAVSSGCIRLMNQDIIDLYNRAQVGDKVIVM